MGLKDKIIAFDIDGTLARNSSIPSLYTINEITRLINEGYHITLSTGRNIVSSINIYNSCNMKDLCVLCNGAMVYDPINNKKITNVTIPLNVVYELIENKELINYIDDLLIEIAQTEGFESGNDGDITVVLDTNLTPELVEEGFMREIISKIQTMRKEAGFEVMDKITVYSDGNDKIAELISKNEDTVKNDVLATEIITGKIEGYSKEWNINGENVTFGVKKNQ